MAKNNTPGKNSAVYRQTGNASKGPNLYISVLDDTSWQNSMLRTSCIIVVCVFIACMVCMYLQWYVFIYGLCDMHVVIAKTKPILWRR